MKIQLSHGTEIETEDIQEVTNVENCISLFQFNVIMKSGKKYKVARYKATSDYQNQAIYLEHTRMINAMNGNLSPSGY